MKNHWIEKRQKDSKRRIQDIKEWREMISLERSKNKLYGTYTGDK